MDIKNAKELGRVADICRKKGIAELKLSQGTIEFKLWDVIPSRPSRKSKKSAIEVEDKEIGERQFSQEELLLWSSAGIPDQVEG